MSSKNDDDDCPERETVQVRHSSEKNILWEICCPSCQMTFSTHFFTDTLSHISFYIGIAIEQQHHHHLHHYHVDVIVVFFFI